MLESEFQTIVFAEIRRMFPGCEILKNDSSYKPGIPDWLLLWEKNWAMLEVKISEKANKRPNQPYYIRKLNNMSFAAFIFPENKEEVLDELQQAFRSWG